MASRPEQFAAGAMAAARGVSQAVRKQGANLAPGQKVSNRARMIPGVTSYSIVPQVSQLPRR